MISEVDLKDWDKLPSSNEIQGSLTLAYSNYSYDDYKRVMDYLKEVDMIRRSQTKRVAALLKENVNI